MNDIAHALGQGTSYSSASVAVGDVVGSTGCFVLHHYIASALSTSGDTDVTDASDTRKTVVLVSLQHSFTHYAAIAKKLGVNLKSCLDAGECVFVDGLTSDAALTSPANPNYRHWSLGDGVRTLLAVIKDAVEASARPCCVIVDDIATLLLAGSPDGPPCDPKNLVHAFVQSCKALTAAKDSSFVFLVHTDAADQPFVDEVLMQGETMCMVAALESGFSKEFQGKVEITLADEGSCHQATKGYLIKARDNGVQLIVPGGQS